MERTHICGGCGSREDVGYLVDAAIAALQKEIATRDSTDSILATRIRELEARLTQRTEQVAALQARVQELEAIKIPDDAFTYCAYCGEKSPVDEHNEDLSAHIKVCPKHPIRDVEAQLTQRTAERDTARRRVDELEAREVDVVLLRDDLEKRTAELEAANKLLYKKNCELGRFETIISDLQAELERVRGELAEAHAQLKEYY